MLVSRTWVTADIHFGHRGICEFTHPDGSKVRPWDSYEEMDDELVRRFNEVVLPDDKCYILGDVTINRRALPTIARLNCKNLILIKGNHDNFKVSEYLNYFTDIRAYHVQQDVVLSHVPIHPQSLDRWVGNIHGHLHSNSIPDPRYKCVSMEHTDYYPVLLNQVISELKGNI